MKEFYQHYITDWMDSTESLDDGAYRVYHVIIQMIYQNGGPVKRNDRAMAGRCNQLLSIFRKNLKTLLDLGKLKEIKGTLSNDRARKELRRRAVISKTKANAGEVSGKSRREKTPKTLQNKDSAGTYVQQPAPKRREEERREESTPDAIASDDGWPHNYRDLFWKAYPNKVGKPTALKKLTDCRKRGVSWKEIMDGLERYIRDKPADRSWLNPQTFINQERWNDQPAFVLTGHSDGKAKRTIIDVIDQALERSLAEDADFAEGEDTLFGISDGSVRRQRGLRGEPEDGS